MIYVELCSILLNRSVIDYFLYFLIWRRYQAIEPRDRNSGAILFFGVNDPISAWPRLGGSASRRLLRLDLILAVNVSRHNAIKTSFAKLVSRLLKEHLCPTFRCNFFFKFVSL